MWKPHATRSGVLLIAALLVALVLAACGSAGSAAPGDAGGDGLVAEPGASAPAEDSAEEPATGGGPGAPEGDLAPIEQRIIKTGEVGLEVDNVAEILARVRGMAVELGGYVGGSQAGTLDESASVTLRIPAARFDELLTRLHELDGVEVISEATREADVTREIIDLEARIRNLEASEESYRVLLDRAEKIEDILTVQSRLDQVRGQIEQLEGQLQTIEGQADLSTLTVTLIPRAQPVEVAQAAWDPGGQLESAVAAVVGIGQGILDALIWFVIVWVPILLVLGIIGVVVLRAWIEVRRRLLVQPVSSEADPMR
ncbi:MAG: DUF4349 domain-containing protein [Candidatus Limnocylindria bacterium]